MSKSKKKAEKTAAAPAKAAGLRVPLDGQYIGKLAGILLAITAVTALLLGAVNYVTAPVIAAATEEKRVAAMQQVLTAEEYTAVEAFPAEGETYSSAACSATVTALSEAVQDGSPVGYVAEVATNGFGGAIDMVVGLTTDGTVTGVAVISHSETPNVGSKVVDDQSVLDRFAGLTGEITVNSGDNRVDAVSGATTSSKAVTAGVNAAIAAVEARQPVLQGAEEG